MALSIAAVPVLTGEASDRFDQMMEQSEERRGSVDFSREIDEAWFVDPLNKTGCRFLLVDSYNKERNLAFYERNGFNYLFSPEEQEREFRGIKSERPLNSRLMYFDLIELIRK